MTQFIFVRHGESEANAKLYLGTPDTVLTEAGLEQARVTGQKLKGLGVTTIVSSPYIRAQQTAEAIASELGIDVQHIKIIEELYEKRAGKFEGTRKQHPSEWYNSHPGDENFELPDKVTARTQRAIEQIKALSRDGLVVVVGHAAAGLYLLELCAGKKTFDEFDLDRTIDNANFIRVQIED